MGTVDPFLYLWTQSTLSFDCPLCPALRSLRHAALATLLRHPQRDPSSDLFSSIFMCCGPEFNRCPSTPSQLASLRAIVISGKLYFLNGKIWWPLSCLCRLFFQFFLILYLLYSHRVLEVPESSTGSRPVVSRHLPVGFLCLLGTPWRCAGLFHVH